VRSEFRLKSKKGEDLLVSYNPRERSPTGACYPDTMLSVNKVGSHRGFHYVFDAKYRISDDPDYVRRHFAAGPPEDTVNKMHAYRDRIVHSQERPSNRGDIDATIWDLGQRKFNQKTVAAFILYPNASPTASENRFFQSVHQFGIGGLPFLPGRTAHVAQLLEDLVNASSETEEDAAIIISTEEERERIEKAHTYGMVTILSSKEHLEYVKEEQIYHMPYTALRGIRLRADFLLFLQTKTQFGDEAGVNYWAPVTNFQVGSRSDIAPPPPWPQRREDPYAWFQLGPLEKLQKPLPPDPNGRQMFFRLTTRLAVEEARTIDELSLVREPERRLYAELIRAGFEVRVRERSESRRPTYDISGLRLAFHVRREGDGETLVRFDPRTAGFYSGSRELFDFEQLMFNTSGCIAAVRATLSKTT